MPDDFKYDVFLSHNSQDKPRVRRLAERLKAAGVQVWLDEWVIRAGDIIALKVDEGLEHSRVLLLCISPAALASGWVALERSTAIHRDPSNAGRRFIPLLLDDCALPDTLRRYKYVDFREESEAAFAEVLASCRPETKALQEKQPTIAVRKLALFGHTDRVHCVAISPDGEWAASGSGDKTVKIWDLKSGACRATLKGHSGSVISIDITADGRRILSGSTDKSIREWDAVTACELHKLPEVSRNLIWVATYKSPDRALSGGRDGKIQIWDLTSGASQKTFECGSVWADDIFGSTVSIGGDEVLTGHQDGRIRLWSIESGECLATLKGHSNTVTSIQFVPNTRFAVSGSKDRTVRVWNLTSESCVGILEGHNDTINSLTISPDGTLIATTAVSDYAVRLWDLKTGACLQVIEPIAQPLPTSVAFSRDSSLLILGTYKPAILTDADGSLLMTNTSGSPVFVYQVSAVREMLSTSKSGKSLPVPQISESRRRYVNAKVVLLGEATVGKTSLAHRLVDDEYVVEDRTHGMNVWRLDLPLPADATLECEALLWDLAGQEDYRLIHRLFLEQTALALLLINPQKNDPFIEAGDWLKALKSATDDPETKRDVARLMIFSQIDGGGMKLAMPK
jgi:WD40 repeat protein